MSERNPYAGVAGMIIDKFTVFGKRTGTRVIADELGVDIATVRSWVRTGIIPEKYRPDMITLAKQFNVPHTPLDYVAYLIPLAA